MASSPSEKSGENEDRRLRLIEGQLVIPKHMLSDLATLQVALRESEDILDYIVSEDAKLAQAIFAEGTDALAAFLFGRQERKANATEEETQRDAAIAKSKYEARVAFPDLKRENERRSRLFMTVTVNGHDIVALVDTGAELSLATSKMIRQCHLEHLVDRSYRGVVCGMGKQDIVGRIHACVMEVQGTKFPLSLYCVEHQMSSPFLLGLDFLWRHDAMIDLREGTLRLGRPGREVRVDLTLKLSRVTDKLCDDEDRREEKEGGRTNTTEVDNCTTMTRSNDTVVETERRSDTSAKVSSGRRTSGDPRSASVCTSGNSNSSISYRGSNDVDRAISSRSCSICRLRFESEDALRRHESESNEHQKNVQAIIRRHQA